MKNILATLAFLCGTSAFAGNSSHCGGTIDGANNCPAPAPTQIICSTDANFKLYDLKLRQYSLRFEDVCFYKNLQSEAAIDQCLHEYRIENAGKQSDINLGSGGYVRIPFKALENQIVRIADFKQHNVAQEIEAVDMALNAEIKLAGGKLSILVNNRITGETKRSESSGKYIAAGIDFDLDVNAPESVLGTDGNGRFEMRAVSMRVICEDI